MWTLENLIKHANETLVAKNNKRVPARPINYKCRTIREKFIEAYAVYVGKAEAFTWPENQ